MRMIPTLALLALAGFAGARAETPAAPDSARPAAAPAEPAAAGEVMEQSQGDTAAAASTPAPQAERAEDSLPPPPPAVLEAPGLTRLTLGGTFQLKAFYHNMSADRDLDKALSFNLRRARIDIGGGLGDHFEFTGEFQIQGDDQKLGADAVFLAWNFNDKTGVRGGKLKRPFSQEALQSSKALYTVERGGLYQSFLNDVTGYSGYDLGVTVRGGFEDEGIPVTYEAGLFNGKQSDDGSGYAGQQYQGADKGFKSKDAVFRVTAAPFACLKAEAAVSTKAAEDMSDPDDFQYYVNTAYEAGLDFHYKRLRMLGEAAWGDNHKGRDSRIIEGTQLFFAFYGMAVWHEDYSGGRASEAVLKLEGLDPDFEPGAGEGTPNDARLRYTFGCNYFFTPRVSILADYGILQPITDVPGEDELVHDLDVMWRMSF